MSLMGSLVLYHSNDTTAFSSGHGCINVFVNAYFRALYPLMKMASVQKAYCWLVKSDTTKTVSTI